MAIVNVREKLTEYFVLLHKKITVNSFRFAEANENTHWEKEFAVS